MTLLKTVYKLLYTGTFTINFKSLLHKLCQPFSSNARALLLVATLLSGTTAVLVVWILVAYKRRFIKKRKRMLSNQYTNCKGILLAYGRWRAYEGLYYTIVLLITQPLWQNVAL